MNTVTNLNLAQPLKPAEYMMVDAANAFGLDKETYAVRLQWCRENLQILEAYEGEADDKIAYVKAVLNIRRVQKGLPIGHTIALDSTTSGVQILSALTGCRTGMLWTNLVDIANRYDCYTEAYEHMLTYLEESQGITRKQAKTALMTHFYGSVAEPENVFGYGTQELAVFLMVMRTKLKGATSVLEAAVDAWQPNVLAHEWNSLPDGHHVYVPVMVKRDFSAEIDEAGHHSFSFEYKENACYFRSVSLAANITHSIDAYIVREVVRRCNYDLELALATLKEIQVEISSRGIERIIDNVDDAPSMVHVINGFDVEAASNNDLVRYEELLLNVLETEPFEVIIIHDSFAALPIFCNALRYHYKEILAELAESCVLEDIIADITGVWQPFERAEDAYTKAEAAELIRGSAYAIC